MSSELFTVYTYGAGEVLWNIFNAVSVMYKDGYMSKLFGLSVMFGLLWAGIKSGITADHHSHYVKWFMSYLFVLLVLLQPIDLFKSAGMTVYIRDVVTGKARKVDNLPPGLVMPAGIISGIGFSSTKLFETLFSAPTPEYLPYHRYGTLFGAQVMSELRNVTIQNPTLRENMESYITNCMLYDVMIGKKYDIQTLYHTTDIWDLITTHSSSLRRFNFRNKGGRELVTCKAGIERLGESFKGEDGLLAKKFPNLASSAGGNAKGSFVKALEVANSFYAGNIGSSMSATDQLRQILIINQFKTVPNKYGVAKAIQNQNTGWQIIGDVGQIALPILHSIFQSLIYACFPIVVTLLFFSGRYQLLKSYFEWMIWIELWPLLFAVLNGAVSIFAKYSGQDITIATMEDMASTQSTYAMMTYSMGLMVPSFAYMISKGGVGQFVHMAGGMMSGIHRGADIAAGEVTSGSRSLDNVSIGNTTMNSTSANKYDVSAANISGYVRTRGSDGAMFTDNLFNERGNDRIIQAGVGLTSSSIAGFNMNQLKTDTSSMRNQVNESLSHSATERELASVSEQDTFRHSVDFLSRNHESILKGDSSTMGMDARETETLMNAARNTSELHQKYGYDKKQAAGLALRGELTGKIGGQSGFTLGLGGNLSADDADIQSLSEGQGVSFSKDNQHVIDAVVHYGRNQRYDESKSQEKSDTENVAHSYEEYKQHQKAFEYHQSRAHQIQRSADKLENMSFAVGKDNGQEFLSYFSNILHPDYDDDRRVGVRGASEAMQDYVDGKNVRNSDLVEYAAEKFRKMKISSLDQMWKEEPKTPEFMDDAKSEIASRSVDKSSVETASAKREDASQNLDHIEVVAESRFGINQQKIQAQMTQTKKEAQVIKDEVDKRETKGFLPTLREWGIIGERNPNKGKKYDDE